jgi:cytoplasmic iron level regulating protein YaaA (DUF328/UPF0246 family)
MKILFSPSETKYQGGIESNFDKNSFIFPNLYKYREEIINIYNNYIAKSSNKQLSELFGTKKDNIIEYYKTDIYQKPILKTIQRYDGVAYDYLKYHLLKNDAQNYIDQNLLIFSNLFGPILAGDIGIPDYKLKQGQKIDNLNIEKFYKEHFSCELDNFLQDEDIIDLRAGFYEKFYTINKPYLTIKFLKNGKVVSHWAKAYRGVFVKHLAQNHIKSIDEVFDMNIENLYIKEIIKQKYKTQLIYEVK